MSNKRTIVTIDSDSDDEVQFVKETPAKKARTSTPTPDPYVVVTKQTYPD